MERITKMRLDKDKLFLQKMEKKFSSNIEMSREYERRLGVALEQVALLNGKLSMAMAALRFYSRLPEDHGVADDTLKRISEYKIER